MRKSMYKLATPGSDMFSQEAIMDEKEDSKSEDDSSDEMSESALFVKNKAHEKQIFDLLESGSNEEIFDWIEDLLNDYSIEQIVNTEGLGLLHVAWQNNNNELVEFIIGKTFQKQGQRHVKMLVNMKCKNREISFTPIHFWAYNGNIRIMSFLVNNGASLIVPNDQGVKAIHVASQGDQAAMIYFLVNNLGWNIEEKDTSGNTALHWAIFTGSENSVTFLLALGANPNEANSDLSFPLHLAVKSIEEHGSLRNIKALLLEGALRTLRDRDKKKPIDYVDTVEDEQLSNNLSRVLEEPNSWLCWMLKTPLKKVRKSRSLVLLFYFILLLNWILMYTLFFQFANITYFVVHAILIIIISFLCCVLTTSDPGYIKKEDHLDFLSLVTTGNFDKICAVCEIATTDNITHWKFWKKWVGGYDHHCPWIDNWVGAKNHNMFLAYVSMLMVFLIYNIVLCIASMDGIFLRRPDSAVTIPVLKEYLQDLKWPVRGFIILNILFCFVVSILWVYVLWIQIGNYLNNATTYQRYSNEGVEIRKRRAQLIKKIKNRQKLNLKPSEVSEKMMMLYNRKPTATSTPHMTTESFKVNLMNDEEASKFVILTSSSRWTRSKSAQSINCSKWYKE